MKKTVAFAVVILILVAPEKDLFSQIAGSTTFTLEKAVVSNGGGLSSGTTFSVEGTSGQTAAGQNSGATYRLQGGFWNSNLAPTAAALSLSGRVFASSGGGLRNAVVFLTERSGLTRTARTTTFGYYRFEGIEAGQTIVIGVRSKLFRFEPRVVTLSEDLADVDFMPSGKEENIN
jgi:hypothetical protein